MKCALFLDHFGGMPMSRKSPNPAFLALELQLTETGVDLNTRRQKADTSGKAVEIDALFSVARGCSRP